MKKIIISYAFLSFSRFTYSQTELKKSFYVSISPLISFQKTVVKDLNNIVVNKSLPSIAFEFGYFKPINRILTVDFGLSIKLYRFESYSTTFPPFKSTGYMGSSNLNLRINKLTKLSDNIFLQNGLCILLGYLRGDTFIGTGADSSLNISRKTITIWHRGIKPFIGINSGLYFKAKRTWYFGLTYYQGLNTYYTTETFYFYNGTAGNSKVVSNGSHLQLDLRIHFNRNPKTD